MFGLSFALGVKYKGTMVAEHLVLRAWQHASWDALLGHQPSSSEVQVQSKLNYPIRRSSREHSAKIRVKWIGNWFSKLGMVRKIKEIR
ncbi:MAG: hypothetical protein DMG97_19390, partial [Acidobacteria bacterium]